MPTQFRKKKDVHIGLDPTFTGGMFQREDRIYRSKMNNREGGQVEKMHKSMDKLNTQVTPGE